jgi:hypothetical protein
MAGSSLMVWRDHAAPCGRNSMRSGQQQRLWPRARLPSAAEQSRLVKYIEQERRANAEQAWTMLARVLLNLDEFVTRE